MKKHVSNMTKASRFFTTIFFLITVCALESRAQSACTQTLRQARTVFDEGRIHELEGLLSSCIKNGFNDEERTEAYRLLILAHIYLDETNKADDAMLALLKDNHGFTINEKADPSELINLYQTFRTDPIFFFGFKAGLNSTFINVQKAYGIHDLNNSNGAYTSNFGFELSGLFEKSFFKRFTAHGDITFGLNNFTYDNSYFINSIDGSRPIIHNSIERQTSLGISIMAQYRIFNRVTKMNPYVGMGGSVHYVTKSELEGTTERIDGSTKSGAAIDLVQAGFRKQINPTADIELGFKKKTGLNYFFSSIRYSYGLTNITDKHYDNGELSVGYGFAPNDINTHSIALSIGLIIAKYSPKKLVK